MKKIKIFTFSLLVFAALALSGCNAANTEKANSNSGKTETAKVGNVETKKPAANNLPVEETKSAERIEVWDGREGTTIGNIEKTPKFSDKEHELVANAFNENLAEIKKMIGEEDFNCQSSDTSLEASGEGAFTKPNTKEKIYLYRKCVDDTVKYPSFINGIIITEDNKIVAHYVIADIGSSYEMKVLPDINKNGLSEFALEYSGVQAFYTSQITLYELGEKGIVYLGDFSAFTNDEEKGEKDGSETAWKVSVIPDNNPAFYRETYKRKNDKAKWNLVKKDEKFSLEKAKTSSADFWKKL